MIKASLFDFDGTLTELTLDFVDLRAEVEKIVLKYVPESLVRTFDGLYILEMIYAVESHLGRARLDFREETFGKLCELEVEGADGKNVYPYTRDVLRDLRKKGVRIGVVTRNCRAAVEKVFPDIAAYVDVVAAREDVPVVKPHPGHIAAVLGLLDHVDPSGALVVGDHPTDILAGRAAGALTVGVLTGRTEKTGFVEAGADFVIGDIRDVPGLVDAQENGTAGKAPVSFEPG
jgi:phosphoglycolate phosphatase